MAKKPMDDAALVTIVHPDGTRIIVTYGQFRRDYEGGGYQVADEGPAPQVTIQPEPEAEGI